MSKTNKKAFAEKEYKRWLRLTERLLGVKTTYGDVLETTAATLLGKEIFKGVFPADQIPDLQRGECCIANLDASDEPGSHWVSITDGLVYDSFGRKSSEILKGRNIKKQVDTEYDAEQHESEDNCGARALAFLICFALHGNKVCVFI